jgi:histidyl-tRNA synthetase
MDIWGEPGVAAEAELIAATFACLDRMGLPRDAVKMRLSSRALLEETLRASVLRDRPEAFTPLCVAIDKLDKIGAEAVKGLLVDPAGDVRLDAAGADFTVDWLGLRTLEDAAKHAPPDSAAAAEVAELMGLLDVYGIADRVVFDASVVRGLAYYTGVVFEAFDADRSLRAICGGGRYDQLLATLGGPATPAVGFGFGDVVIAELLADRGLLPDGARRLDAMVFAFTDRERPAAVRVAQALRAADASVELVLDRPKLKRVLADADKAGAKRIYLIGPDELARGEVLVRDLASGEQHSEPIPE